MSKSGSRRHARLDKAHRWTVYTIFLVLFLTGVLWLWWKQMPENDVLGSVAMTTTMKIHGAAGMLTLVILGSIISHVKKGWMLKKNRFLGVGLLGSFIALGITGWGLYYLGGDLFRHWASIIHWGLGLVLPLILVAHIVAGKK